MVVALFLLALSSFVLMGLFVLWLTIRNGIETRRRLVDEQAVALEAAFESRRRLADEAADAIRPAAPALAAELERTFTIVPSGIGPERAARDARVAATLDQVLGRAEAAGVAPGTVAGLRDRARDADGRVSAAARSYNAAVTDLNGALAIVPARFVGRLSRVAPVPTIRVGADARAAGSTDDSAER